MTKILTQRAIETAKPKAKRYGKPDGLVPGMQLIVQSSGSKSFVLFTRLNGKLIHMRIGAAGVISLAQAREQARAKLGLIAAGTDPRAVKHEPQAIAETFAVVAERFVERHAKVHTRKWREIVQMLERDVLPRWGRRPIDSITKADVIALLDAIVDRGSPVMANRTLAAVRRLFNWCIERGTLESSPTDRVKKPGAETARDRVLDDRELALVWAAAGTLPYPSGPMIRILALCGQRRTEVSGMRWCELDRELTLWTIPRERVKTGAEHHLPVSAMMAQLLRGLPRVASPGDFVFTNGKVAVAGFTKVKDRLDAAIAALNGKPIGHWTLHDLRRSLASGMARIGIALPTIERALNHRSGSFAGIVGVYQRHTYFDEMRVALEAWGRHLAAIQLETELRRGFAGR